MWCSSLSLFHVPGTKLLTAIIIVTVSGKHQLQFRVFAKNAARCEGDLMTSLYKMADDFLYKMADDGGRFDLLSFGSLRMKHFPTGTPFASCSVTLHVPTLSGYLANRSAQSSPEQL